MTNRERLQHEKNKLRASKAHFLKCQDCGERKEDVVETECPYAAEMGDPGSAPVLITVCRECRTERAMDI